MEDTQVIGIEGQVRTKLKHFKRKMNLRVLTLYDNMVTTLHIISKALHIVPIPAVGNTIVCHFVSFALLYTGERGGLEPKKDKGKVEGALNFPDEGLSRRCHVLWTVTYREEAKVGKRE